MNNQLLTNERDQNTDGTNCNSKPTFSDRKQNEKISQTIEDYNQMDRSLLPSHPMQGTTQLLHPCNEDEYVRRPMNAFMVWSRAERRKLALKFPNMLNCEISKLLGAEWSKMTEEDKKPFILESKKLRTIHSQKYPEYSYRPRRKKRKQDSQYRTVTYNSIPGTNNGGVMSNEALAKYNKNIIGLTNQSEHSDAVLGTPTYSFPYYYEQGTSIVPIDQNMSIQNQVNCFAGSFNRYDQRLPYYNAYQSQNQHESAVQCMGTYVQDSSGLGQQPGSVYPQYSFITTQNNTDVSQQQPQYFPYLGPYFGEGSLASQQSTSDQSENVHILPSGECSNQNTQL